MKKILSSLCLLGALTGCATMERGQIADLATTLVAFEEGYVEGNPIMQGLTFKEMVIVKYSITQGIKWLAPEPICTPLAFASGLVGYGAAAWNVGVMAGSGPIGVGLYAIAAYFLKDQWMQSASYSCSHRKDFVPIEIDLGLNSQWFNDKNSYNLNTFSVDSGVK